MARKFSELTKDLPAERRERIEAKKAELRKEMDLAEIRQALSLTQSTLADTLGVGQAEVSKIENRADMFVSTLRRFVNAMGGELEIRAVFPEHTVMIKDFASLEAPENQTSS